MFSFLEQLSVASEVLAVKFYIAAIFWYAFLCFALVPDVQV